MSEKTSKPSLYLLVVEETTASFGDRYYKQTVRVVTQKYESGRGYLPYGCDDTYGTGLLYSGLRAGCQGDEKSRLRAGDPVYGYEYSDAVGYQDVYRVNLGEARRMAKTLETIDRRLAKMREKRGYVTSWGEFVGRLAEVLGCEGIGFERSQRSQEVTGYRYDWKTIGEGVNEANGRVWQWQREGQEAAAGREAEAS